MPASANPAPATEVGRPDRESGQPAPPNLRPPGWGDYVILAASALALASSFGAITLALQTMTPMQVAAARCTVAAVALWILSRVRTLPAPKRSWAARMHTLGVALLGYAIPFAMLSWAEQRLAPGLTAMLFCAGPVWAILIGWVWQRDERRPAIILLPMAGCTAGIALLSRGAAQATADPDPGPIAAVLACALCYALAGAWARRSGIASSRLTRDALTLAAACLLAVSVLYEPMSRSQLEGSAPWAALYLGLIPTALCSRLRYWQNQELGYTFVSYTGYLVPIFGALLGVLFFSETITDNAALGLALCLAGLGISRKITR